MLNAAIWVRHLCVRLNVISPEKLIQLSLILSLLASRKRSQGMQLQVGRAVNLFITQMLFPMVSLSQFPTVC